MNLDTQALVFRALGEPIRIRILLTLIHAQRHELTNMMYVSKIVDRLNQDISVPSNQVSHHLQVLKRANLVHTWKNGRMTFYGTKLSTFEEATQVFR